MSEFKDCPVIPELNEKVCRLIGQVKAQLMPTMPTPHECPHATPGSYDAAEWAYKKAWDLVLELGEKKASVIFEDMIGKGGKLETLAERHIACSDPDHQCRREVCVQAKRLSADFDNARVALFQSMVRDMDSAKEAFIEEASPEPVEPVEEVVLRNTENPSNLEVEAEVEIVDDTEPTEPTGETPTDEPF